jgi:hypothetical protein
MSNRSSHLIPVIGIPMLPNSYFNNESTYFFYFFLFFCPNLNGAGAGLDSVISGQHDEVFVGIVKAFIAQGFTTLHLRIGWEMNGNWYSWNFNGKNATGTPSLFSFFLASPSFTSPLFL